MPVTQRLDYLDWARGLAVVLMMETHAFESWLLPGRRNGEWFWLSQFLGGFAAPLFLLLVGISLALVLDRMRTKGATRKQQLEKIIRRSAWILFLAYAYRFEQSLMWSNWAEFFRVDILNCIGAASLVGGLASIPFSTRRANIIAMTLLTGIVVLITPWVYPIQTGLPHFILGYLNGDGHPYYFSLFSWIEFPLAGMAFGYGLLEARARGWERQFFLAAGGLGALSYAIGRSMWLSPIFQYGFFDYSLTSPHYFFVRIGWMSIILYGIYRWTQRAGTRQWNPMQSFGKTSLLVYWLHLEIVYGIFTFPLKRSTDVFGVVLNLLWLVPLMLVVSEVRQRGFANVAAALRLRIPALRRESVAE